MILIIGASGNLGQHILREVNDKGIEAVTFGRSDLPSFENTVHFQGDLLDFENYRAALDEIFSLYPIDCIVYNSAFTVQSNTLSKLHSSEVDRILGVNFIGYLSLLQKIESLPNSYGQIKLVYISSNSIQTLRASNQVYIASKAAAECLSLSTTKRLAERLVINVVRPGLMNSEMTKDRFDTVVHDVIAKTPIKKLVNAQSVAKTVLQTLAGDVLIGQIITVDGGRTI